MLAGQITAPGRIELIDVAEPGLPPAPGHILFQPELACLCGSDLPYFDGQYPDESLQTGHSLHEIIGTVIATNGKRFRPGDRVLAVPVNQVGLFERFPLAEDRAILLDPRAEPELALLAQPLGTVLCAIRKLPPVVDQTLAVVGQGPIGQMFCAVLRNLGARKIIAIDRLAERLAVSRTMGATDIICTAQCDPVEQLCALTDGALAELVIEAVGHRDQQLNLCIELCRAYGRILCFGVPSEHPLDGVRWHELFRKNQTVQTSVFPDFARDFPLAMQWIAEGRVDLRPLLTHRFPLERIQTAFETFCNRSDGALKVLIEFPTCPRNAKP